MLIRSPDNLAQFYRDRRKQLRISQAAIAEEASIRQGTVSKFELKPDNVRLDTLFRLLSALDMELHIIPKDQANRKKESQTGWTELWKVRGRYLISG
jgi:HTH-type transcriptional regulator/antitoxin HipB